MVSLASIVIPAHNEAGRIRGLLETLSDSSLRGCYDVFVVCNGCIDDTRKVAGEYDVTVVEIDDVGKSYALNEGDRLAGEVFPRLYCDADIRITPSAIRILVDVLTTDEVRVAGPEIRFGVEGASWPVRMYYRALESVIITNWQDEHLTGRGLYGVSRAARCRFAAFPIMVADDLFLDSQFTLAEKVVPPSATAIHVVPRTFRQLMRGEIRVALGNHEHRVSTSTGEGDGGGELLPSPFEPRIQERITALRNWRRDLRGRDVVPLIFYLGVISAARVVLVVKRVRGRQVNWR